MSGTPQQQRLPRLDRIPLDNGKHSWEPSERTADLGTLSVFPAEILAEILHHVDIPTLTHFRSVNRQALTVVDAVPSYNFIFKNFPAVLRAVVVAQARAGPGFTCANLARRLRAARERLSAG